MSASGKSFITVGNPKARLLLALSKVLLSSRSMVEAGRGIKVCAVTRSACHCARVHTSHDGINLKGNDLFV